MTKVLLVEDDKSLREIYGVRLLAEGYDIVSAGDGEEALAMAIKERPQLIVSDVMMPKISGFDMLDILRSTTETKSIKVIMMTALSSEDQRARGEALGADRYLVKSQVGIEDVVRTVHEVLGDAPVTSASPTQMFGTPAPTGGAPRPVQPVAPRPAVITPTMPTPAPQPVAPTPMPSVPAPQPSFTPPTPGPMIQQRPQAPQPVAPAPASTLPQPTAPFSTTRPANLGDRIIHPISAPAGQAPKPDLGSLMDQELNGGPVAPAVPAAAPPPPPPVPAPPSFTPTPSEAPMFGPQPPMPSSPDTLVIPTSSSEPEPSGISFEETPLPPSSPPQSAPFTPGPQPPSAR
jgi:CheY-like chemotaxis protein